MVDDGPAAGNTADAMVAELQLQPASPQAQDNPGAVLMASSKEKDTFGVKGPEVELRHQSKGQHRETNQLQKGWWLTASFPVRARTGLRKSSMQAGQVTWQTQVKLPAGTGSRVPMEGILLAVTQSSALKLHCGCICAKSELMARRARMILGASPGTWGSEAVTAVSLGHSWGFFFFALCKRPSHLVGCSLLKRSLITGVPLNKRPRYKDFMLLATLKGTQGKMSCQNGSGEHQAAASPGSAPLPVMQGLSEHGPGLCVLPQPLPSSGPSRTQAVCGREGWKPPEML